MIPPKGWVIESQPIKLAACAQFDRFLIEYSGQFFEGEGFATPEERIKFVVRMTVERIEALHLTTA